MSARFIYLVFHTWLANLVRFYMNLEARLLGHRFYCRALAGRANYGVSVNSDLTVSCNCQDRDGQAVIGDLRVQTFAELWSGERAMEFRRKLAAGVLPIRWCVNCPSLSITSPEEAAAQVGSFQLPRHGVMVENTAACNLRCTSCDRTSLVRRQTRMSPSEMESVAKQLADMGCRMVQFLKLGEPFASPKIAEELNILRAYLPKAVITTSTNGLLLDRPPKVEAALRMDLVMVSLFGSSTEMCNRYQHGQNFERTYANMKALVAERNRRGLTRPAVCWKWVLFWWNDKPSQIEEAQRLAREAGVDFLLLTPTLSPPWAISIRDRATNWFRSRWELTPLGYVVPVTASEETHQWLRHIVSEDFLNE